MYYQFVCPKCNLEEIIEMKMSEYTSEGHKCKNCDSELVRDISTMKCGMFSDKSGDFYKRTTF